MYNVGKNLVDMSY